MKCPCRPRRWAQTNHPLAPQPLRGPFLADEGGAVAHDGGGGVVRLHRDVEGAVAVDPARRVLAGDSAEQAGQRLARGEEGEHTRGEGPAGEARVGVLEIRLAL
eukprot:scaffold72834_cov48-Phaeocystis_antarctica.AAC.3